MATQNDTTPVEYRDIPGFPGYRAGDDGSVWSSRTHHRGSEGHWYRLKPYVNNDGRPIVSLVGEGRHTVRRAVHRVVLEAFVGPRPEGMEACHFPDQDPRNNRLENLRWDTPESNRMDTNFAHAMRERFIGDARPADPGEPLEDAVVRLRADRVDAGLIAAHLGITRAKVLRIIRARRKEAWP